MIRGICKTILLILTVSGGGVFIASCAGGPSGASVASTDGLGTPTNAATPYPSGQGTQEGHGVGDLAILKIEGTLSDQDTAALASLNVTQTKFIVALESGEDPDSASAWTPVGNVSASSLSLLISASSRQPPPHLSDVCIHPFLRLTPVYEVKVSSGNDTTFEFFKGLPVIQKCPVELEAFSVQLPLQSVCHQCKAEGLGKLEMKGELSEEDATRLSQFNVVNPLFEVNVETGLDPDSADQWTPVGSLSSTTGLVVSASDEFGSLPPHLSDFCLFPFLRQSATYHVEIQGEKGTDVEDYENHNIIQECPAFMETVSVTLPTFVLKDNAQ